MGRPIVNVVATGTMRDYDAQYKIKVLKANIPFADQVTDENTKYVIRWNFDLDEEEVEIPANCILQFEGGSLRNGVLAGDLITDTGELDVSCIGCVYGRNAENNSDCFKILEGINNKIKLVISHDLYLSGYSDCTLKNFIFDGKANTLYLDKFDSFRISGDIDFKNTNVVSTSRENCSRLFICVDNNVASDINVSNCSFTGNFKLIKGEKRDSEGLLVDLYKSISFCNNKLENIYSCKEDSSVSSTFVHMQNSNVIEVTISNNIVHNFFGLLFDFSTSNGSIYTESLPAYYKKKGRTFNVLGNIVYNDIDYKPWINLPQTAYCTYHCFCLLEVGEANVIGNTFKNIISLNNVAYDNYLSVDRVFYEDNTWINNISLRPERNLNVLIKAKTEGIRIYKGNTYIFNDISDSFEEFDPQVNSPRFIEVHNQLLWDTFIFSGNIIDAAYFWFTSGAIIHIKNQVIENNVIRINTPITDNSTPGFFTIPNTDGSMTRVSGNALSVENNDSGDFYFLAKSKNTDEGVWCYVNVFCNTTKNVHFCRLFSNTDSYVNIILRNNEIHAESSNFYFLYSNKEDVVDIRENKIYATHLIMFKQNQYPHYDTTIFGENINLFDSRNTNLEKVGAFIKVRNGKTGVESVGQVNYDTVNETRNYYNTSGEYIDGNSDTDYKMIYKSIDNSVNVRTSLFGILATSSIGSELSITFKELSSIHEFRNLPEVGTNIPRTSLYGRQFYNRNINTVTYSYGEKFIDAYGRTPSILTGGTASRPNNLNSGKDLGFQYYDRSVHEPIYWDSKWVRYDGASADAKRNGIKGDRPIGTLIYKGFRYFDTTLGKPIYWNGTYWVDSSGNSITWDVTYNLTNVSASNDQQSDAGSSYTTVLSADEGYTLPATITVKMGSTTLTVGTDYTYNQSTGEVVVLGFGGTGGVTDRLKITATGIAL